MQPAGQDPKARVVPGTVTLPLCSWTNASPFWIMLLLVWARSEHGMNQRHWVAKAMKMERQHWPTCRGIVLNIMIHDLITAFLVAFAAVTASDLLIRIWEYF